MPTEIFRMLLSLVYLCYSQRVKCLATFKVEAKLIMFRIIMYIKYNIAYLEINNTTRLVV